MKLKPTKLANRRKEKHPENRIHSHVFLFRLPFKPLNGADSKLPKTETTTPPLALYPCSAHLLAIWSSAGGVELELRGTHKRLKWSERENRPKHTKAEWSDSQREKSSKRES